MKNDNEIAAIRVCGECRYHETAVTTDDKTLSWSGDLKNFMERCVKKDGMPENCPKFKKSVIKFRPEE